MIECRGSPEYPVLRGYFGCILLIPAHDVAGTNRDSFECARECTCSERVFEAADNNIKRHDHVRRRESEHFSLIFCMSAAEKSRTIRSASSLSICVLRSSWYPLKETSCSALR